MTDTKHTPGPWMVKGTERDEYVEAKNGAGIVSIPHAGGREENHANATLIAVAPDLLAACEDLMAQCQKWAPTIDRSRARAAIAKAKGEK